MHLLARILKSLIRMELLSTVFWNDKQSKRSGQSSLKTRLSKVLTSLFLFRWFGCSLVSVLVLNFAISAQAQNQEPKDLWGVDGRIRLVERIEESKDGEKNWFRGQARINGWVQISEDGCVKAKARVSSGTAFNNEWIATGVGDEKSQIQVGVRHLYVDATCLKKNIGAEIGTIPARPEGALGNLGLTELGWLDGLRVTVRDEKHEREVYFSIGEISDAQNPNTLTRNRSGINHAAIEIKQAISENKNAFGSVTVFDKRVFTRAGIQFLLKEYKTWLKQASVEVLASDNRIVGQFVSSDFDLGKLRARVYATNLTIDAIEQKKLNYVLKNSYGYGKNAYFEISRDLFEKRLTLHVRARVGQAGKLLEAGITAPFRR